MIPGEKSSSSISACKMYNIAFIVIVFFLSVANTKIIKEKSEMKKSFNDIMPVNIYDNVFFKSMKNDDMNEVKENFIYQIAEINKENSEETTDAQLTITELGTYSGLENEINYSKIDNSQLRENISTLENQLGIINITHDINDLKQGNEELKDEVNLINAEILQLKLMRDDMNSKISELATQTIQRQSCEKLLINDYSLPGLNEQITKAATARRWEDCKTFMLNHMCRNSLAYTQLVNVETTDLPLKAASSGYLELIKVLVENGLRVNRNYDSHNTMLHLAAMNGKTDVAYYLLTHGADTEATDCEYLYTPLHDAAKHGNFDVVKLLAAFGAQINSRTKGGNTPLHIAAERGNVEIVEHLLKYKNCDQTVKNAEGKTAYNRAVDNGHKLVVEIFSKQ